VLSLIAMAGAIGALPGTAHPFVLFALLGLFVGLPTGELMALSIKVLKPENLDFGLGVFYFWLYALFTVLPSAAGAAADLTGNPAAALYFAAGLAVAALLLLFALLALQRAPLRGAENVQERLSVDSHE
jgi:hypothetical protein